MMKTIVMAHRMMQGTADPDARRCGVSYSGSSTDKAEMFQAFGGTVPTAVRIEQTP